jgi:hypothetical protein
MSAGFVSFKLVFFAVLVGADYNKQKETINLV